MIIHYKVANIKQIIKIYFALNSLLQAFVNKIAKYGIKCRKKFHL